MHENLEILRNVQLTQTFTHKNALKSLETLDPRLEKHNTFEKPQIMQ